VLHFEEVKRKTIDLDGECTSEQQSKEFGKKKQWMEVKNWISLVVVER
jgi:hypothetical protein